MRKQNRFTRIIVAIFIILLISCAQNRDENVKGNTKIKILTSIKPYESLIKTVGGKYV